MGLLRDIPVEVKLEEVTKRLRMDRALAKQVNGEDLTHLANSLLSPQAIYAASYITDHKEDATKVEEATLTSRVLARNLEKVGRVFAYVITIGGALEEEASKHNMLERLFLENAGDAALNSARIHVAEYVSKTYEVGHVSHMGPGQLDWPVEQQKELFSLFEDVEGTIGVRLTSSMMMVPRKSVSGVMFPKEATFTACQLCPRENCPSRQAPYSENLRRSHGLDAD
jgi:hypothetical protein